MPAVQGMKLLHVHAHFDDFEFASSGLFEVWRRKLGLSLFARVLICTDGKAGHHFRSREETMRMRMQEQQASAYAGEYESRVLRYYNGEVPREACLHVSAPLLAALWKEIRDFEPDYLFAPPVPTDPLAGIHVDHVAIAEAVRKVAYMINVPHAFTPEYPAPDGMSVAVKTPVILTVYDAYMRGANAYDLAIDVEESFDVMCRETWCHQSQIMEWLPWVGRHEMPVPDTFDQWSEILRGRFTKRNREMGVDSSRIHEFFTVTAWGEVPEMSQITRDFPNISEQYSNLERLEKRLNLWRGTGG